MLLPAPAASRPRWLRPAGAFTLIELLVALAVLATLSALGGRLALGLHDRAARDQAKAELKMVERALEAYCRHYGTYPRAATPGELWAALAGELGPGGARVAGPVFLPGVPGAADRSHEPLPDVLTDPWGWPYRYERVADPSDAGPYRLYSVGPDGAARSASPTDSPDSWRDEDRDNVYASR